MLKLKNSGLKLLRLDFTGYQIDSAYLETVLAWLESRLEKTDYYGQSDNVIFLRNPPAETMMKIMFHEAIIKEYKDSKAFRR